ncbi:MAG: DUF5667 domain-containing protein [bacterium]|nr:DUF5667 domain-containing protein [bacterium]
MKKIVLIFPFAVLALLLTTSVVFAADAPETTAILEAESLNAGDLGVSEPTLLPTSPFYFFKTWRSGFQRFFTFNPVKKAELELKLADEKIAEAKKVAQINPERTQAIEEALANYQTAQERLKAKLEALKETSQNPKVDELLEKLVDRAIKHEKIFAELAEKFADKKDIKERLEEARGKIEESLSKGGEKDEADKFARKISKALEEIRGSDLKHAASLEILDRLGNRADEKLKEKLDKVRQDISEQFKGDLEEFAKAHATTSSDILKEVLQKLPGDKARRLVILEEIGPKLETVLREALKSAGDDLEEEVGKQKDDITEKVREAIKHAKEKLAELEKELLEYKGKLPAGFDELRANVEKHLDRALKAFDEKKFGEAFGQARAAEVLARNALRAIKTEHPDKEDVTEDISELRERLDKAESAVAGLADNLKAKAEEILKSARLNLVRATEAAVKGEFKNAKRYLEEAKSYFRLLERIFKESRREKDENREKSLRTESRVEKKVENKIEEKLENIKKEIEARPTINTEPRLNLKVEPVEIAPTVSALAEFKVEADDGGFYPTNVISVTKGSKVRLHLLVRTDKVYFGGLDFRSDKFKTESVKPGGSTSVEFVADESFVITSWWPVSSVRKADLKIEVR